MNNDTHALSGGYTFSEGIVEEVGARTVVVKVGLAPHCSSGRTSCGLCGSPPDPVRIRVPVRNAPPVEVGARVRVRRHALNPALAAGAVFGIPLLGVILALVLRHGLAPARVNSPMTVLLGFAGLAAGAGMVCIAEHLYRGKFPTAIEARPASTEAAG